MARSYRDDIVDDSGKPIVTYLDDGSQVFNLQGGLIFGMKRKIRRRLSPEKRRLFDTWYASNPGVNEKSSWQYNAGIRDMSDEEKEVLGHLQAKITNHFGQMEKAKVRHSIAIGRYLCEARLALSSNGERVFTQWIKDAFKLRKTTAYNLMYVYETFGNRACKSVVENISISALYLLSAKKVPESAITAALEIAKSGVMLGPTKAGKLIAIHRNEATAEAIKPKGPTKREKRAAKTKALDAKERNHFVGDEDEPWDDEDQPAEPVKADPQLRILTTLQNGWHNANDDTKTLFQSWTKSAAPPPHRVKLPGLRLEDGNAQVLDDVLIAEKTGEEPPTRRPKGATKPKLEPRRRKATTVEPTQHPQGKRLKRKSA